MERNIYDFATRVRYEDFAAAARTTVQAIASRAGDLPPYASLEVNTCGGRTAHISYDRFCEHLTVALPSYAPDTIISGGAARRLLAYVIHETLHALYSDMSALGVILRETARAHGLDRGLLGHVANALEDYFIERIGADPASPITGAAADLLGFLNSDLFTPDGAAGLANADPVSQAGGLVLYNLNRHGRQVSPALDAARPIAENAAAPAIREAVALALDTMDREADRDDDARKRRDRMFDRVQVAARLIEAAKQQQQQDGDQQDGDQQQQDGDQQDGQSGDQQQQQDGQSGAGDQQDGDQQQDGQSGAGDQQDGQSGDQQQDGEANGADMAPLDADAARDQAMQDAMPAYDAEAGELARATVAGTAESTAADRTHFNDANRYGGGVQSTGYATAQRAMNARRMADAMRRGLRSVEVTKRSTRELAGRLDSRAFARGLAGARDIYRTQHTDAGVTTAVQIMLDASASMNSEVVLSTGGHATRWTVALATCRAALDALRRAGAKHGIAAFSTYAMAHRNMSHDINVGTVKTIKRMAERMSGAEFDAMLGRTAARGGTPMMQEARWARDEVLAQRVSRRVVIWLCDGNAAEHKEALAAELERHRAAGVEHYGIGVDFSGVEGVFGADNSVTCQDLAQLPDAMRVMLERGHK